ncbi:MAG: putative DNA binding domain-containing protein [Clostridiales bacterium]|nr:putative DNA binding domain-containing protein [Clostridiales bacterium]
MIPLKIEILLQGRVVEQNRVEYKSGWNPNDCIHTICAYANDYNNMNGGYLVIGVSEKDGLPVLPPVGVPVEMLDSVQQEIFQYCNQIQPRYIPKIEVINYQESGIYLLYLWCCAGDSGPYQAPADVYAEKGKRTDRRTQYWIRPASLTAAAKQDEIAELFDKFNSVPYDDRVNRKASIKDIRRGFVEDFLRDSNSTLADDINKSSLEELLFSLEVANETDAEPVSPRFCVN